MSVYDEAAAALCQELADQANHLIINKRRSLIGYSGRVTTQHRACSGLDGHKKPEAITLTITVTPVLHRVYGHSLSVDLSLIEAGDLYRWLGAWLEDQARGI